MYAAHQSLQHSLLGSYYRVYLNALRVLRILLLLHSHAVLANTAILSINEL